MQSISVTTAQNVDILYRAASVGDRILAFLIDGLIRIAYALALTQIYALLNINPPVSVNILLTLPALLYYLWMEVFFNGQSVGKMALNLKVVMLDGSKPTVGAYLVRWILRVIDVSLFFGGVAVLVIVVSGKGQRLGDLAAGTAVVTLQKNTALSRAALLKDIPKDYKPTFTQAADLGDSDVMVIMEALEIFRKSANRRPAMAAESKVKQILDINSDMPTIKFLYQIVRDHNYLTAGM